MRFAPLSLAFGATIVALQTTACGDAAGPKVQTPAAIDIVSGDAQTPTEVATRLSLPLTVRVTDGQGATIAGATVGWSTSSGSFNAPTSMTDARGVAAIEWTLGEIAGNQTATAVVLSKSVLFRATAIAGPLSQIVLGRDTVRLLGAGDVFRLSARATDRFGNPVSVATTVESPDTTIVSVQNLGNGALLTAHTSDKTLSIQATAGSVSKTGTVIILPAPCQSGATATSLAVGQSATFTGFNASEFCLDGTASGAEFTAIPFFSDFSGSLLRLFISTAGTTTEAAALSRLMPTFQRTVVRAPRLERDGQFDLDLRERSERELKPLMPMARAAETQRSGRFNLSAPTPRVGDLLNLNTNSSSACANPTLRTGRVVAITSNAIVVADTANPANGFTTQDYESIGAGFDTLVYPVDTLNFGAPTDEDKNQHIILFFTRAVNELTPPGQNFYVGGFFYSRDLFPATTVGTIQGCAASNFAEMFYMLVPDPTGVVNQNVRTVDFVRGVTLGTLAHEFQHLINSSRHLYTNASGDFEDVFLDEGLAHEAEELVFFRASGLAPGQNLSYESIQSSQKTLDAFNAFEAPNFRRLREFLANPEINSPYASDANLPTRGAIWSFLRYAADRRGGAEQSLWFQLANPPAGVVGVSNLNRAITSDLGTWIRDWSIANYTDDFISGVSSFDSDPSWNLRSIMNVINGGSWPMATQPIDTAGITSVAIGDGSAAYLRFGVRAGAIGGGRMTTRGPTLPATFSLTVIRTK
ncbi:MAG TPA: Ig-like domain-containing protein [Gemmatimonadaceae bacterium]